MKLLAQHKSGVSSYQFSDIGRIGHHQDLHLTLCLRSAVWLLAAKNCEDPDVDEVDRLSAEVDWLCAGQSDKQLLVKTILQDATWGKFVKYTLRVGLRAQGGAEAALPLAALRLFTLMWKVLAAAVNQDVLSRAQQVAHRSLRFSLINIINIMNNELFAIWMEVYEMVSSHSEFMSVILDEDFEYRQQKQLLLELLIVLVEIQPKLCQSGHVPLLLASYQASRSCNDQLILRLLHVYEENGVQLSTFK